jgi:hypothetical protein
LKKWVKKFLWHLLPRGVFTNGLLAVHKFIQRHGRLPLNPVSRQATFEDYVFHRMIRPWTPFEETCVDKEYAKGIARSLSSGLRSAKTHSVFAFAPKTTLEQVGKFLYPFIGKNFVAKPTHSSGGVVFLANPDLKIVAQQIAELFQLARQNYFFQEFEVQYLNLLPKIIVEEGLPLLEAGRLPHQPPPDFRFYASRGKVIFCQYDQGRFADHRQALFTVPDHQHISIADIYPLPEPLPQKPAHWNEMIQTASDLSKPFDFVRVDLYDLPDGVYFSEFTFTPNATLFPYHDRVFSRKLLEDVLDAMGADYFA